MYDFYRDNLQITLSEAVSQPETMRADMGVAYATGMGASQRNPLKTDFANSSADFIAQRESIEKTKQFFKHEGKVLRFQCVEVCDDFI